MRCFVAVDVPDKVKDELKRLQDLLKGSFRGSFSKDSHLTLKFLGEITPEKIEFVKEKLRSCKVRRISAVVDNFGVFPSEKYVRVLWVGISPEEEIIKLQKEIDEVLQQSFPKEKNFKAHLTLARVKHIENKEKFLGLLQNIKIGKVELDVNEFKLKRSVLTEEGPVYEDLETYKA